MGNGVWLVSRIYCCCYTTGWSGGFWCSAVCQNHSGWLGYDRIQSGDRFGSNDIHQYRHCHPKSWFLSEEHVVSVKPRDWIDKNDKKNVLNPTSLALGCATAGLDILQAAHSTKPLAFIVQAFKTLNQEIADCRTAIRQAQQNQGESLDKRLQLRAWAIDLAVRCSHAAIAVSSGAANYSHHAAQRVYREALVFTVSGQTTAVMAATLARLQRSEFEQAVVRR